MTLPALFEPEPWQDDALCRGRDPDLFFIERTGRSAKLACEAKTICAACPVRADCLGYALRHRIQYGIWGGMTAQERRAHVRYARKLTG